MLALSVLPAEHVHASGAGKVLVHRHVIDDGAHHSDSSLDHGKHATVTTLEPAFDAQRRYEAPHPLTASERLAARPDLRVAGRMDRIAAPPAHGPPIRVGSLRGPPA